MEERPGDSAAPAAGHAERIAAGVDEIDERLVLRRGDERRIVELVPADDAARGSNRAFRQKPRLAIAEMKPAFGEARRMSEQSGHRVADTLRVLDSLAEHHVPAALAMNGTRGGEAAKPVAEAARRRKVARAELRISARQPAYVAILGRRLVGQR